MNKRISFLSLISSFLFLTSCGIEKVPDFDKLIIGSFPIVQTQDGQQFDHYLYVDFLNRGEEYEEKNFDLEIDLNNPSLETKYSTSVDSLGNKARFVDLSSYVSNFTLSSSISQFLESGGSFVFIDSVGKLSSDSNAFVSKPLLWNRSGVVLSFGVNEATKEDLKVSVGTVYKEEFQL